MTPFNFGKLYESQGVKRKKKGEQEKIIEDLPLT